MKEIAGYYLNIWGLGVFFIISINIVIGKENEMHTPRWRLEVFIL